MYDIFAAHESNVRVYCRSFPAVFSSARGSQLWDRAGIDYIDLFSGAGTLNYGHNPESMKSQLISYILEDGVTHSLDMYTEAKEGFIEAFQKHILVPRDLAYRQMFPGPTGTNAIEAAIKLARNVTGRTTIAAFTNGFHGMSLGALAATGSASKRRVAGISLSGVQRYPFDGFLGPSVDTISVIERLLDEPSSGYDAPAAFLVETVQGEGGINAASGNWLRRLSELARRHGSLLIVDDIQAGCGRTGTFFSFETMGIRPDIVCLSKALSGYGLPFALVLMRPELDVWRPGEHNGTFRGNNLAFVTGEAAIQQFWRDDALAEAMAKTASMLDAWLAFTADQFGLGAGSLRGRGLMRGIALPSGEVAERVVSESFKRRVLIETSGGRGEVLKFLPALTISPTLFEEALDRISDALSSVLGAVALDQKERATV